MYARNRKTFTLISVIYLNKWQFSQNGSFGIEMLLIGGTSTFDRRNRVRKNHNITIISFYKKTKIFFFKLSSIYWILWFFGEFKTFSKKKGNKHRVKKIYLRFKRVRLKKLRNSLGQNNVIRKENRKGKK